MLPTAEGRLSGGGLGDTKVSPDETDSDLSGSGGKTGDSEPSLVGETTGDPVSSAVVGDEPVNSVFSGDEPLNSVFSSAEPINSVFSGEEPVNSVFSGDEPVNSVFPVQDIPETCAAVSLVSSSDTRCSGSIGGAACAL